MNIWGILPQADGKQGTRGALAKGLQPARVGCRHRSGCFGGEGIHQIKRHCETHKVEAISFTKAKLENRIENLKS